jgi:hypothetical protein
MGASFFIIDEGALEVAATTETGQAVFALKKAGDIILEVIKITFFFVRNHLLIYSMSNLLPPIIGELPLHGLCHGLVSKNLKKRVTVDLLFYL